MKNIKQLIMDLRNKWEKNNHLSKEIKTEIGILSSQLKNLSSEEKKSFGSLLFQLKKEVENHKTTKTNQQKPDIINPTDRYIGSIHPLNHTIQELHDIMEDMGFEFIESPHIETAEANFDLLNTPKNHPCRTAHDTFFLSNNRILRTQTTATSTYALRRPEPIKTFSIGEAFRNDYDSTHLPAFRQIECLYLDQDANMSKLFFVINTLLKRFFGKKVMTRFRPSSFPFTTPSVEVDIASYEGRVMEEGETHTQIKWLEIGGSGMLHPNVLTNCNKPNKKAFAFGLGVDRLCMLKNSISDIRLLLDSRNNVLQSINKKVFSN